MYDEFLCCLKKTTECDVMILASHFFFAGGVEMQFGLCLGSNNGSDDVGVGVGVGDEAIFFTTFHSNAVEIVMLEFSTIFFAEFSFWHEKRAFSHVFDVCKQAKNVHNTNVTYGVCRNMNGLHLTM